MCLVPMAMAELLVGSLAVLVLFMGYMCIGGASVRLSGYSYSASHKEREKWKCLVF